MDSNTNADSTTPRTYDPTGGVGAAARDAVRDTVPWLDPMPNERLAMALDDHGARLSIRRVWHDRNLRALADVTVSVSDAVQPWRHTLVLADERDRERIHAHMAHFGGIADEMHLLMLAERIDELLKGGAAATTTTGITSSSSSNSYWPKLDPAALYGLAGDFVTAVSPQTEAAPPALLFDFHLFFGNAAGRNARAYVGSTAHFLNEFGIVVGATARARKDTALNEVRAFYTLVDKDWTTTRVQSGLSSGEGLIYAVRDPSDDDDDDAPAKKPDSRLLAAESEFTGVLKVAAREGNPLSEVLRQAWDGKDLGTLTKNKPMKASEPHISVLGSVTMDGLTRHLTSADAANGLGNRFLFILVKRARLLPSGGDRKTIEAATKPLVQPVKDALAWARKKERTFTRDPAAEALWERLYAYLADDEPESMIGALTQRADVHILRLSCIYAALDQSEIVTLAHLRAAVALWRYAEQSAAFIFGDATGKSLDDRILAALAQAVDGLIRTTLHKRLGNNVLADDLTAALKRLLDGKRITETKEPSTRKPATRYRLAPSTPDDDDPWREVLEYEFDEFHEVIGMGHGISSSTSLTSSLPASARSGEMTEYEFDEFHEVIPLEPAHDAINSSTSSNSYTCYHCGRPAPPGHTDEDGQPCCLACDQPQCRVCGEPATHQNPTGVHCAFHALREVGTLTQPLSPPA